MEVEVVTRRRGLQSSDLGSRTTNSPLDLVSLTHIGGMRMVRRDLVRAR
jgi:hypothetical protein